MVPWLGTKWAVTSTNTLQSGEFGDIIANSNGPGLVTIAASDKAFESRRCQWTKV